MLCDAHRGPICCFDLQSEPKQAPGPVAGAPADVDAQDYAAMGRLKLITICKKRGIDYQAVAKDKDALVALIQAAAAAGGGGGGDGGGAAAAIGSELSEDALLAYLTDYYTVYGTATSDVPPPPPPSVLSHNDPRSGHPFKFFWDHYLAHKKTPNKTVTWFAARCRPARAV